MLHENLIMKNSISMQTNSKLKMLMTSGADPGIFYWGQGGRGVQTLVQKGLQNFLVAIKLLLPHTPFHQSQLHIIISWPLTLYLNFTSKGCTPGTSSSCAIIVDQLRKQRGPISECQSPLAQEILLLNLRAEVNRSQEGTPQKLRF